MRAASLGGTWPALLASDLGAGKFDGAHLVENFENLNPANTYFDKYYNLFAKIDTEPRALPRIRALVGRLLPDEPARRSSGSSRTCSSATSSRTARLNGPRGAPSTCGRSKSPIILFASLGDNITPPQQAFNWVADLYPTTEEIKANGQVIVGLMHEDVGHLGIFVSGTGRQARAHPDRRPDRVHRASAARPLRHAGRGAEDERERALRRHADRAPGRGPSGSAEVRPQGRDARSRRSKRPPRPSPPPTKPSFIPPSRRW